MRTVCPGSGYAVGGRRYPGGRASYHITESPQEQPNSRA
jgi:hypothetical protein